MEKRRVTVTIGGQPYSFYSDDSDEYISVLEQKTNTAMKQTAEFCSSTCDNAVLSALFLADQLLRMEQSEKQKPLKNEPPDKLQRKEQGRKKTAEENKSQLSVWDLLNNPMP